MRTTLLAAMVVLAVAAPADAQIFGRRANSDPLPEARFPRLAAFARPVGPIRDGYRLPAADRSVVAAGAPQALSATVFVMAFMPPPLDVIGFVTPRAIRLTHVVLNGSPTPGRPIQTVLWVASPLAADIRTRFRERGGLFGRRHGHSDCPPCWTTSP